MRGIYQLQLHIAAPGPLLNRKQCGQSTGVQHFHVRQINHHNTNVFLRENRVPKRAYSSAANDPPDASHNRHIARFFHIDGKHDCLPYFSYYANRRQKVPDVTTSKVKSCNVVVRQIFLAASTSSEATCYWPWLSLVRRRPTRKMISTSMRSERLPAACAQWRS